MNELDVENILVVVEKDKSGEILVKRAKDNYGAFVIEEDSLKDIDVSEFKRSLKKHLLS